MPRPRTPPAMSRGRRCATSQATQARTLPRPLELDGAAWSCHPLGQGRHRPGTPVRPSQATQRTEECLGHVQGLARTRVAVSCLAILSHVHGVGTTARDSMMLSVLRSPGLRILRPMLSATSLRSTHAVGRQPGTLAPYGCRSGRHGPADASLGEVLFLPDIGRRMPDTRRDQFP